jgi:hypothetical protein
MCTQVTVAQDNLTHSAVHVIPYPMQNGNLTKYCVALPFPIVRYFFDKTTQFTVPQLILCLLFIQVPPTLLNVAWVTTSE